MIFFNPKGISFHYTTQGVGCMYVLVITVVVNFEYFGGGLLLYSFWIVEEEEKTNAQLYCCYDEFCFPCFLIYMVSCFSHVVWF